MTEGDSSTFKPDIHGTCPFCKKVFQAGKDSEDRHGVVHELPICEEFEKMEPTEYLKAVRLKYSS